MKKGIQIPFILVLIFFGTAILPKTLSASEIQSQLNGTWKSVCMNLDATTSIIVTLHFDGAGNSNDKTVFYKGPGCGSPSGLVKTSSNVRNVFGKAYEGAGKLKVYPINITAGSWQLIQDGTVIKNGGAVPTQYDILAVSGNKLFVSGLTRANKGPITNPAQRPKSLDQTHYYTKQ